MAIPVQWRRGTSAQTAAFTGAIGEITVNTTTKRLHLHDGVTPGGTPFARLDEIFSIDGSAQMTGVLKQKKSASIASAGTVDLSTATGNEVHITGSTGPITSFGTVAAGVVFLLIFDATPTLTYNAASMILNTGGVDFVAAAGDRALAISEGAGNWNVTLFRADGTSAGNRIPIKVRQAIQYGPTTGANSVSDLIPQSQINNTLATGITAKFSTKATLLSCANGFNSDGSPLDVNVIESVDRTLTNLTGSTTNIIAYDLVNKTLVKATIIDTDTNGGTPAITNGLYTFDYANWKMYLGNGSAANRVSHVIIAEVDTDATKVTAIRCRAYQRQWASGYTNTLPGASNIEKNHNVGTDRVTVYYRAKCITVDGSFTVGKVITPSTFNSGGPYALVATPYIERNTVGISKGSSWLAIINGVVQVLTDANWSWELVVKADY